MVSKKYVPILKSKQGEMTALKHAYDDILTGTIPLIEILPTYTVHKSSVYTKLSNTWRGSKLLVDVHYCEDDGLKVLSSILSDLKEGLKIIPVLRVGDDRDIVSKALEIASVSGLGVCLRINPDEIKTPGLINDFISTYALSRQAIVLLADFGYVNDENEYSSLITALSDMTELNSFNALVIASGSSPASLDGFTVGEDNFIERLDWLFWRKYASTLSRSSVYSDYTTQHPEMTESGNFPGSKSIRYTIKDQIVVYRGRQADPFEAYLEHAANLCDYTDYFCGPEYSYGDQYIKDRRDIHESGGKEDTGNATSWVGVRTSHHIAFVVKHDLAAIPLE